MNPVTPTFANSIGAGSPAVQAADVSFALTSMQSMFDWSKGATQKNSARITHTGLPKAAEDVSCQSEPKSSRTEVEFADRFANADLSTKVFLFLEVAQVCPKRVPELIAREARQLNAVEFAKLMSAMEESGGQWGTERYFVFNYASGSVGSVWLAGIEVYNSIWKNY